MGALAALAAAAAATLFAAAPASAATARIDPLAESRRALVFPVAEIREAPVTRAKLVSRKRGRAVSRRVAAERLASAPEGRLRVRKPQKARGGVLVVTTSEEAPDSPATGGSSSPAPSSSGSGSAGGGAEPSAPPVATGLCDPDALAALALGGCSGRFADDGTAADPAAVWGKTDCADTSRHRRVDSGGDRHPDGSGSVSGESSYRELTVLDGDDVWGERCELGRNDHRNGPTVQFREGDRAVTFASFRLPDSYPLENTSWQVLMQMKQTQPAANGGGTPVISLEAKGGRWRLLQSTSSGPSSDTRELWTAPAQRGVWTRFAFDVTYSQDPSIGAIRVHADLDGDGTASAAAERSPRIGTYTLKRETEGGSATDGIAPGESIPSHLRMGIYHHPQIPCPPPTGCAVEIDNVQILGVS